MCKKNMIPLKLYKECYAVDQAVRGEIEFDPLIESV